MGIDMQHSGLSPQAWAAHAQRRHRFWVVAAAVAVTIGTSSCASQGSAATPASAVAPATATSHVPDLPGAGTEQAATDSSAGIGSSGACRWCSYYARFSHGLPPSSVFFPIALWDQYTASTTKTGPWGFNKHYANLAAAASGMGVNTFLAESSWPDVYGIDTDPNGRGFLQAACNAGDYVIAGGDPGAIVWRGSGRTQIVTAGQGANDIAGTFTLSVDGHTTRRIPFNATPSAVRSAINTAVGPGTVIAASGERLPSAIRLAFAKNPTRQSANYSHITDTMSIASVQAAASKEKASGSKKSCTTSLAGYMIGDEPDQCTVNIPADVAAMHAIDPTRLAYEGMAAWVTWDFSGCSKKANANFRGTDLPASDDYHDTDAWNTKYCTAAAHVATSPVADCSWLYGYQAAIQARLAGSKPTWEVFETGNDVFFFSEQNGSSCNTSTNICAVHGVAPHEYNATAPQVNANVWGGLMNGAAGIVWFCDGAAGSGKVNNGGSGGAVDSNHFAYSDCLGGTNSYSLAEFSNLQYIDQTVESYAPELNTVSGGACTMQPSTYSTIDQSLPATCTNGDLTISTSSTAEPIQGMTKFYNGHEYLFVMADRANGSTVGTYTVTGYSGDTATLVYDSAARYDSSISEQGKTFTLNGSSQFSDTLVGDSGRGTNGYGAGANSYQVKIYEIS